MRKIFWPIVVAALATGLFAWRDQPINDLRQAIGLSKQKNLEKERQSQTVLQVAILRDRRREGRRIAILVDDWLYCYPKTLDVFLVPRGYVTDFASIPSAAQLIINPFGDHVEASVIHDWLYAVGESQSRIEADQIFRFAMKEQGVNLLKRNIMYRAVRLGGSTAFGRDSEWNFGDPRTAEPLSAPFEKPTIAAVTKLEDCSDLSIYELDILSDFGT